MGSAYCRQSAIATCTGRRFFARHPNPYEVQSAPLILNGVPSDATQWLSGERAISIAIISYGAVVSTMRVYSDFLGYLTGVYQRRSADFQGRTAVQLIGWGVEPSSGAPYWLAESNWGQKWGESQYFKACSVRDCWGEFCPPDNMNPTCSDSAAWADTQGYKAARLVRHCHCQQGRSAVFSASSAATTIAALRSWPLTLLRKCTHPPRSLAQPAQLAVPTRLLGMMATGVDATGMQRDSAAACPMSASCSTAPLLVALAAYRRECSEPIRAGVSAQAIRRDGCCRRA